MDTIPFSAGYDELHILMPAITPRRENKKARKSHIAYFLAFSQLISLFP